MSTQITQIASMGQFLKLNPSATLKEYVDYVNEAKKTNLQLSIERQKKANEFYRNLNGRYFFIDFNGNSHIYIQVVVNQDDRLCAPKSYEVLYKSGRLIKTTIDFDRSLNRLWFDCPYDDAYSHYSDKGVRQLKEITKVEFDSIVEKFETINNLIPYSSNH